MIARSTAALASVLALLAVESAQAQSIGKEREIQAEAAPASEAYPASAVGEGNTVGGYNQSRWAEDWSGLRDPAKRDDPLDALKFLPLQGDDAVTLTLAGEARLRVNHTTNPNLLEAEAQRQDILRLFVSADLHVGEHLRGFVELAHGHLSGVNLGTPLANLRNDLAVQQYFVDATADLGGVDAGIRYGRQTFADGPNLITVPRDNNTLFFTFNGVRAWARGRTLRADVFDLRPTQYGTGGTGDDVTERERRFSGISTGIVLPPTLFGGSELFLDPFAWRLRDRAAQWGAATAREEREFYGLHFWGDVGPLDLDWTVNHQAGRFDGRPIAAWQVFVAQSYRIGEGKTAPRLGLHADYASGGGAYGGRTLRNALAPFGNNIYYSYQLYATPTNFMAIAPNVSFEALSKVRATLEYQLSWRDDVRDAVYRANGSAFGGTQNVDARKIADTWRAQIVWSITPRLSFTGRYEHLNAGRSLTGAGYRNSDFLAGWLNFRF